MAVETEAVLETRLTEINTAIHSILVAGQSYGRPGHNKSSASLSELRSLKKETEKRLQILRGVGSVSVMQMSGAGVEASEWGD